MAEKLTDYVQFYTTKVEPAQTQGDIIGVLHRYGCSGFGFRTRGSVVEVTFHVPKPGGVGDITICIPLDIERVFAKLQAPLENRARSQKQAIGNAATNRAQAERVAWRILLSWIHASLSAVSVGAQTIEEAFFAHRVIETTDGQTGRMIDYVSTLETAAADPGKRLPNPGGWSIAGTRDRLLNAGGGQ